MSIHPVQAMEAGVPVEAGPRPENSPSAKTQRAQTDSGNVPRPEVDPPQNAPISFQAPQDEVQVQRDSEANGVIVIQYVDHSGTVVLQVPSSQLLGMMRAIDQTFQEEAKVRSNQSAEAAANRGGKTHGH